MGFFHFFKKSDNVGKDSAIDSNEIIETEEQAETKDEVITKLSYHPDWKVPQEQQYIFNFLANELKPLKPNQLSLAAINIEEDSKSKAWHVKAFLRSSLPKAIQLKETELLLIDQNGKVIGSKNFNLQELGTLPPESARPWVFTFEKSSLNASQVPKEGWTLAFNLTSLREHQLDLDESWKQQLSNEQQEELKKIVKQLPKLKKNEINFTGLQAKLQDDHSLIVSILIRNGNTRKIQLEQIPLEIIDANQQVIAKGSFKMDPVLTVQPNATKPWTFIFPSDFVSYENADLSHWTARVIQKK